MADSKIIKFHDLEVPIDSLIFPKGRRVSHCWGKNWTRVDVSISDFDTSYEGLFAAWIEENLSGARYNIFTSKMQSHKTFRHDSDFIHFSEGRVTIGFENHDDAIMFKLLDGHLAHKQ